MARPSCVTDEAKLRLQLGNHLGQLAIPGRELKDMVAVEDLLARVQAPCNERPAHEDKAGFPPDWALQIEISCSS